MILVRRYYPMIIKPSLLAIGALLISATAARATSTYHYGADEYVTIASGISPNGEYAITAHGEGEEGSDNFHIFLTDAASGKKIGPLTEISEWLDTGADAFCAKWSEDSTTVTIVYRWVDRKTFKAISYRINKGRARRLKGPYNVKEPELFAFWMDHCSGRQSQPSPKIFGTPVK
jgi:hypothetical protein